MLPWLLLLLDGEVVRMDLFMKLMLLRTVWVNSDFLYIYSQHVSQVGMHASTFFSLPSFSLPADCIAQRCVMRPRGGVGASSSN